ncbi:hypothetical protein N7462_002296 [Penicillium macrosclerotiorum]|uniref:uncharacterized protein n=1 Tax=Penicillium macrosclerotiorum TaxID=303699 RepID=UPI002547E3CB|nr:uncharacterized protein N7462_002296 [Penicillium macrosclerotiorum]KAJ5692873.1 hypothetical protein N7462_002296 [Penicillium macrosclerotiorum]
MSKSDLEDSSGSDSNGATEAPLSKPKVWQRLGTHMKKWWWIYLIAFCCIFLVVFLPIIYVGIPHFANKYIDGYQYDYQGLAITNPRPMAFHISQSKKISMGGGFSGSGHLSAFNATIRVPGTNEEIAVFPVPEIKFDNGADLNIDQDFDMSCVDCLSKVAVAAASNESFAILVTGKPDLTYGGLPTAHLNIHKTMNMNGYNVTEFVNSEGAFNITSLELLDPEVDGYNFNATLSLRNPTPFTVEMGHVTFNLSMGGTSLGYVDLPHLMLEQHNTSTLALGNVNKSMLIQEVIWSDGDSGEVTIDVRGHSCDYNGQEIPYFAAAIKAVSASAKIDLLSYVSDIL